MENKLVTMVEFLFSIDKYIEGKIEDGNDFNYFAMNYAKFLNQPNELKRYIACDKDGKPMEKPENYQDFINKKALELWHPDSIKECKEYQEALKQVWFEGVEVKIYDEDCIALIIGDKKQRFFDSTIEDLTGLGLNLTESALKEIYG